ncbi:MAG: DUF3662 and FHA domain-containing protein, partial [Micrococcus sp.]|nr:DUF3662 and FHA domain-containing protein [Micrococcus sp.]
GLLDNLERGLEKAVRTAFSAGGNHAVKPVEIAAALRHAMDDESVIVSEGHVVAPNSFTVHFSTPDFERARTWGTALAQELCDEVIRYADSQGYSLPGTVRVAFHLNDSLREGRLNVQALLDDGSATSAGSPAQQPPAEQPAAAATEAPPQQLIEDDLPGPAPQYPAYEDAAPAPTAAMPAPRHEAHHRDTPRHNTAHTAVPAIEVEGALHPLHDADTVVGRSSERSDVVLSDTSVSRAHVQLVRAGSSVTLIDLGSRNGVQVNGQDVDGSRTLRDGDRIVLGQTTMRFHADGGQ